MIARSVGRSVGRSIGASGFAVADGGVNPLSNAILLEDETGLFLENGTTLDLENGPNSVSVTSPSAYQVFQRGSGDTANIAISGSYTGTPTAIEARWNGGSWATIDAAPSGGSFSGTLSDQASGQGTLEVRFANDTGSKHLVWYVGVGEVFSCWGQSNMSGRGNINLRPSHATLKACLYGNDNTWKELLDPYDSNSGQVDTVSSDSQAAGSFVVPLATELMATLGCPVAFIPCALGGTSITQWQAGADHLDRSTLYGSANYRTQQAGGCRCVLWWQGETDALASMADATYNSNLDSLAADIATDLGVKIMPCKLQNSIAITDADELLINDAIGTAWADNANVATGPDLTTYGSDDDFHLEVEEKLEGAAGDWHDAIIAEYFTP